MLVQSISQACKADGGQTEEIGVTYGTCRQDDFLSGRDCILDAASVNKDARGIFAVLKKNFLHQRRLIEVEVRRLTQGIAQEGCLG